MFYRLFAEAGLSLDRLRALVEVGAFGSITRATGEDPARQSLYSRQIKELEDFFRTGLVERHGRGIRLTSKGTELARISRFFLMSLSNFQRGCLAEEQIYRIGAGETVVHQFLVPLTASRVGNTREPLYALEAVGESDIERRLHDLTLDFGVIGKSSLSRPLQTAFLSSQVVFLCLPKSMHRTGAAAEAALRAKRIPVAWPAGDLGDYREDLFGRTAAVVCPTYLDAMHAMDSGKVAAPLPMFLCTARAGGYRRLELPPELKAHYHLAWNPRLLRLNPHAAKHRDALVEGLRQRMREKTA